MFILRQTSVKMAVLLHKQAKVPFILIIAVYNLDTKYKFHNPIYPTKKGLSQKPAVAAAAGCT